MDENHEIVVEKSLPPKATIKCEHIGEIAIDKIFLGLSLPTTITEL